MKRLIPVFLILFFFVRCGSDQARKGVIPKDDMIALLTDIHVIDGYSATINYDTANHVVPALYLSAFKKYGTDSAQFNRSLKFYSEDPKLLSDIYKQVSERLETLQKAEDKRSQKAAAEAEKARARAQKRFTDSLKKEEARRLQQTIRDKAKNKQA